MTNKQTVSNEVEILEEWRKDWSSPDIWVKIDQDEGWSEYNRILLREHTVQGIFPFVEHRCPSVFVKKGRVHKEQNKETKYD